MLLAIDVGNTHTVFGMYRGKELEGSFRLQTDRKRTVDEYALEILSLIQNMGCSVEDFDRLIMSCVVPPLTRVFTKLGAKYFNKNLIVVGPGTKTGMKISVDDPRSVGADRIVNAVSAKDIIGCPAVVVDFGTATTFDVVSADGSYEGGVIAPGLIISAEALFERAALLQSIELKQPARLIGKNTQDSMLSGIMFGYASLVDGILKRLISELGENVRVIATGGMASLIASECSLIERVVGDLTLQGLQIIADKTDE